MSHAQRLDYAQRAPDLFRKYLDFSLAIKKSSLETGLQDLVTLRASQLNGCAYCIHMHATEARGHGETEMRLYMLNAWRESTLYSDRERAALAWTDALTLLAGTGAPDADYELLKAQFNQAEQVNLTIAIGAINTWNRLQVGFRAAHPVGPARAA